MTTSIQAKGGLQTSRRAWWSGFQITVAGAARVAGDVVAGDLKKGHIVQLDPFDLDAKGLGVGVCRPTSNFRSKLFVVQDISADVNEVITDSALATTRRRGGWINVVPCSGIIEARINGAVVAASVGLDAGLLQLDATAGYDQYMNLIAGSPTTVAHLKTLFAAANQAQSIALAMEAKGAGVGIARVQFCGLWDQGQVM